MYCSGTIDLTQLCLGMLGSQWYQMQFSDGDYAGYESAQQACENVGASVLSNPGATHIGGGIGLPSISNAQEQVEGLLANPACAHAIGAPSTQAAVAAATSASIVYGTIGLPYLTVNANGALSPGQQAANYNPNTGGITLNSAVNWSDPSEQVAINPAGQAVTVGLSIPGVNVPAGGPVPWTSQQFMDFYILHELAHSFGLTHTGRGPGQQEPFYNEAIWNSCFH
jgi:hypothetical protein